jgi:predicted metalloprotease with PDZ domain
MLVRAGLMTSEQYLSKLSNSIGSFENTPGRRYQSATESSQNTWNSGSGIGGDRNTTISYYNNGAMLGAMLDLKIRDGSRNKKSLDDVMRALYQEYHQQKKRGFTDAEFRAECEAAAGANLEELFEYAATSKDVNYGRYLALAGLKLDVTSAEAPGGFIGLNTRNQEIAPEDLPARAGGGRGAAGARGGRAAAPAPPPYWLMVTEVVAGSPAAAAGLKAGDRIVEVESAPATPAGLNNAINAKAQGESLKLRISRAGAELDASVAVARNTQKKYQLSPDSSASPAQKAIFDSWMSKL